MEKIRSGIRNIGQGLFKALAQKKSFFSLLVDGVTPTSGNSVILLCGGVTSYPILHFNKA
jgi:hypothetical protein